jgi:uncharacterized protein
MMPRARDLASSGSSAVIAAQLISAIAALVAVLSLAACAASQPTHFYTLAAVGAPTAGGSAATAPLRMIAVGPVSLPSTVDRPQLVTRDGPYGVTVASRASWAGDLNEMVSRVLVEDLAARLPGDRVVGFPRVANPAYDVRVAVDIARFDVGPDGDADVAATWQVFGPVTGKPLLLGATTARPPSTGKSYDDRVAALSRALGEVADAIAHDVSQVTIPSH